METRTRIPQDTRDLLAGSVTIAMMLLVSGSAKVGYGARALGIAALTCILCHAGKYAVAGVKMLFLRFPSVGPFCHLRARAERRGVAATSATKVVPEHGPSGTWTRVPVSP